MDLAIKEAWKYQGLNYPNPAVGAVIVDKCGKILSISAHKGKGTAHAELNAISEALKILSKDKKSVLIDEPNSLHSYILKNHNSLFKECTIYVTLEPCNHFGSTPPCALLISTLKFKRVVIATPDLNPIATGGIERLKKSNIEVVLGVCKKKADKLIEPFVRWSNSNFIFFKLAMSLNGVIAHGIISSKESRKMVHILRDKIDLLVIGGNTIREDNPILDARMVNGKAPDILIYSHNKNFDLSLNLFKVKNRKVFIEDNFDKLSEYNYIMIEGGEGMLKATQKIVNWYLFYQSDNFKSGKHINFDLKLTQLNSFKNSSNDKISWYIRS